VADTLYVSANDEGTTIMYGCQVLGIMAEIAEERSIMAEATEAEADWIAWTEAVDLGPVPDEALV
jgi:hypothetical protein